MARFILVPALVLFALVSGEGLFMADQVSAACCMCGTCKFFCTCPGKGTCPYCAVPDFKISQASNAGNTETLSVRGLRGAVPSIVVMSEAAEQLVRFAEGQCGRSNLRLKLLEQAEYTPRFESVFLKDSMTEDNVVAFQITVDER